MLPVTAMILAAGRGERLRPLTDERPKPLLEIGGRSLLDRHLDALAAAGVTRAVVNLSWLGGAIVEAIGGGAHGIDVVYSDEGATALETAGGIAAALPLLGRAPFWLVNGDVYTDFAFDGLALAPGDQGHILVVENPAHNTAGDFAVDAGRALGKPDAAVCRYTYSGIARLHPSLFAGLGRERRALGPLLFAAARAGRLAASVHDGVWDDIGTVERLRLRRAAEAG
ncbi:MAG: nucleotidyltransferase family protein [Pseudomonadota bacterium]